MGEILTGTCGYSYAEWKGSLYPEKIKPGEMLPYYAQHFPAVEIDATYYRVLPKSTFESMERRTPEGFRFSVKLPGTATHAPAAERATVHDDVALFYENLEPLVSSGKLACVLMQFPNSFKCDRRNAGYVEMLRDALKRVPLVAEFRNRDWQSDETLALLRALDIGLCNVDGPQYKTLPRATSEATSQIGYVRFHGRNYQQWWKGDSRSRYDYLYPAQELQPWVDRIEQLASSTKETLALFNNHANGHAATNAKQLQALLANSRPPSR
ncbi:MAG: DUF72 domain-containing protein [Candidatus Eremiobacteraeota bacterium]|nr:DUF72 domain-containing protein [Candidatus Eremiobacteraeota bacterium]